MSALTNAAASSLNEAYRDCATRLLARADALVAAGRITPADREIVYKQYLTILQSGMHILQDAAHDLLIGLTPDIKAIQDGTKDLQAVTARIETVTKVVDTVITVAAAVGAVAVAIASPNPASVLAAAAALGTATQHIIADTAAAPNPND